MATKLLPVGSEFQVNSAIPNSFSTDGTANSQDFPSIATLSDGRYAVVYQSNSSTTDIDIHAAFVTAAGVASQSFGVDRNGGVQSQPVAAGRGGGGFGVAFTDTLNGSDTNTNINWLPVSNAGTVGTQLSIAD